MVMLVTLIAVVLVFFPAPGRIFLRFPLTTFLPLAFLLAYLRALPYRVGVADSLSRMFIQVVPLAILFVASAAASKGWASRSRGDEPQHPSVAPSVT